MADTFNMSDVFISYSRKNSKFVRKLYDAFKALDKEIWVDFEDIPLTADWWQEIQAGIDAAETFIFVLTPDSARSKICRDEIEHAINANKRIIPILHQEILEDNDKEKVHDQINAHNWIFFRDEDNFDEAFKKLLDSVETDLDHNRTHTRLLVRAKDWNENNKNKSYLLHDQDLQQAEMWLMQGVNKSPTPTTLHAEYITASRQGQIRRQRNALIGVTVALGVAIALTIFSVIQWRDAQIARQQADVARDQAEQNAILARSLTLSAYTQDALSDDKPDLAIALALESVKVDDGQTQVLQALRDAAYAPGTRLRLTEHTRFVWDVDFDRRGGRILSGSADHTACLWDTRNGERIACMGEDDAMAHESDVIAVQFLDDGQRALTADDTGVIKMWHTDPRADNLGQEIMNYVFDEPIQSFQIMPDGQSVLVGLANGDIYQWALDDTDVTEFEDAHSDQVNAIAISADGEIAISVSNDDLAFVWDLETREVIEVLQEHTDNVLSVAINDDGTQALTGGQDDIFVLWDLSDYSPIYRIQGHDSGISDVAFGPKPTQITTASWDNSIRIWNTYTRKVLREFEGHTGGINRIDLTEDGWFIVSGSFDTDIRLWETHSFIEVGFVEGDGTELQYLVYSPDGEFVATAHDSGNVQLWNTRGYTHLKTLEGHTGRVVSVAISPNNELVAGISDDNALVVWDWESGEQLLELEDIADRLYMVLFGASNDHVYIGLRESIRWYDISTGEQLGEIPYDGAIGGNNSLSISADGQFLLAGLRGSSDNLRLIDLETGEVALELEGHTDGVLSTSMTTDGKFGVSGSWDNSARVWDLETGEVVRTLTAHTERVSSVDITSDGKFVITGSNDRSMHLWNLETGVDELEYNGHTDRIQVVAFHPNGKEMISGAIDTTSIVWRFPHPLDQLLGWIEMNRYVPDLNCTEREVYQINPCGDE